MSVYKNIIAEIGSVHDGSFGNACKLIELAARSGADIVKFQTHIADAESLHDAPSPSYFKDENRNEYFNRTSFNKEQLLKLVEVCKKNNVSFLSSPFSIEAVDLLESVGVEKYKIPSGEVTNLPLIEKIYETKKDVFISSGMSNWLELDKAVSIFKKNKNLVVMQCTSAYPCPPKKVGLNVIDELHSRYNIPIGYSDHTNGFAAGFAAAAKGAVLIEKHLTFSNYMYGSDAANAMEPDDFKVYCQGIKEIWEMLDNPIDKDDVSDFKDMKLVFEKSIVTARNLSKGEKICFQDLAFKKPGDGISASEYKKLIGRFIKIDLPKDTKLSMEHFE